MSSRLVSNRDDFAALAEAMEDVILDEQLAARGIRIVYALDTNVVFGAIFPDWRIATAGAESASHVAPRDELIRALWMTGRIQPCTMLIPHLLELRRKAASVAPQMFEQSHPDAEEARRALTALTETAAGGQESPFDISQFLERAKDLPLKYFVYLEAAIGSLVHRWRVANKILTMSRPIVAEPDNSHHTLVFEVASTLSSLRHEQRLSHNSITDADALLDLALHQRADDTIALRLYSHAPRLNDVCGTSAFREMMEQVLSRRANDVFGSAIRPIRTSLYFLLRFAIPSLTPFSTLPPSSKRVGVSSDEVLQELRALRLALEGLAAQQSFEIPWSEVETTLRPYEVQGRDAIELVRGLLDDTIATRIWADERVGALDRLKHKWDSAAELSKSLETREQDLVARIDGDVAGTRHAIVEYDVRLGVKHRVFTAVHAMKIERGRVEEVLPVEDLGLARWIPPEADPERVTLAKLWKASFDKSPTGRSALAESVLALLAKPNPMLNEVVDTVCLGAPLRLFRDLHRYLSEIDLPTSHRSNLLIWRCAMAAQFQRNPGHRVRSRLQRQFGQDRDDLRQHADNLLLGAAWASFYTWSNWETDLVHQEIFREFGPWSIKVAWEAAAAFQSTGHTWHRALALVIAAMGESARDPHARATREALDELSSLPEGYRHRYHVAHARLYCSCVRAQWAIGLGSGGPVRHDRSQSDIFEDEVQSVITDFQARRTTIPEPYQERQLGAIAHRWRSQLGVEKE